MPGLARPAVLAGAVLMMIMMTGCGGSSRDVAEGSPAASVTTVPGGTVSTGSSAAPPADPPPEPEYCELPPTDAPVEQPALRDELLAMLEEDQAVRTGIAPPGDDRTESELTAAWPAVDRANGARMTEILDEHGWPGWSLVGSDGAFAAWVLIQHADLDLPLQKRGLELMEAAVAARDADPSDLAYLVDRVRVAESDPQVYGTQVGGDASGEIEPRTPIEDESNVDARRAAACLGTLEEYYAEFRSSVD